LAATKQVIHCADAATLPGYVERSDPEVIGAVELGGVRAFLGVPMLKENKLLGALLIYRQKAHSFTDKQIALITSFAAQSVIAIKNARLLNELRQSLQQQTATADVLKVISRSTFDLQIVLNTLTESAMHLCRADNVVIFLREGDTYRLTANYGYSREYEEFMRLHPITPGRGTIAGRTALECRPVHVSDIRADADYTMVEAQRLGGFRTMLGVPLMRDGTPIGVMTFVRNTVQPFSEAEIDLATTFADQAVIAIANVRLFEGEQQRARELTESLQQQTATADVLKVISRSTFDLQTVLDTLTESAARLCSADKGGIFQRDGDLYRFSSNHGFSAEAVRYGQEHPLSPSRASLTGRVALEGRVHHIPDVLSDPEYRLTEYQQVFGYRTNLGVPLLREGSTIGVFSLTRKEVNPFTDKQIELVTTFADQAVIAIENARLLSELRESLQRQTATADVLKVISRSTFDLHAVMNTLLQSAARLCAANKGAVFQQDGDLLRMVANCGFSHEAGQYAAENPGPVNRGSVTGRVLLEGKAIHIPDVLADPEYAAFARDYQRVFGYRTYLGVPLQRDGTTIGSFSLTRDKVSPFTEKQIELATTFADQAVIAIENVRLLDELRARTDQLAGSVKELQALGEVRQAVNSTLDLETVLSTIVAKAVQLSGTEAGAIYVFDNAEREFHLRATYGMDQELITALT
jgi:GAF domain-containing protein